MKKLILFTFLVCTLSFLSGPVVAEASSPQGAVQAAAELVNVNTASAAELQKLPGIGRVTAQSIIEFRTENGDFAAPEDLLKVKGIGPKTLEGILPQVVVN